MMQRTATGIACGILIMLALVTSLSACEKASEPEYGEPKYAGPMTEGILTGMNRGDYTQFSKDFDRPMRDALPEANFIELRNIIKPLIGDYVSKEFWTVEEQEEQTIVRYNARYTEETADVIVTVSFQEIEGQIYVSGVWFDSPKLRK